MSTSINIQDCKTLDVEVIHHALSVPQFWTIKLTLERENGGVEVVNIFCGRAPKIDAMTIAIGSPVAES